MLSKHQDEAKAASRLEEAALEAIGCKDLCQLTSPSLSSTGSALARQSSRHLDHKRRLGSALFLAWGYAGTPVRLRNPTDKCR
jgi:hypothetical protein